MILERCDKSGNQNMMLTRICKMSVGDWENDNVQVFCSFGVLSSSVAMAAHWILHGCILENENLIE